MLRVIRVLLVGLVLPLGALAAVGGGALLMGEGRWGWGIAAFVGAVVVGVVALWGIFTMFVPGAGEEAAGIGWVSGFVLVFAAVFVGGIGVPGWMTLAGAEAVRCEVVSVDDGVWEDGVDGKYVTYSHVLACPGGYPATYHVNEQYVGTVDLLVDPDREVAPEDLRAAEFMAALGSWGGLPLAGLLVLLSAGRAIYWFRTSGPSSREPAPRS
ncbi:hypothetical protein [Actinokineospora globicatena]|uniref:Uncharacterized protein n=1 Tax=Actinokineospora globicatena TaxID=103729 RepID=A0A9W6QR98_9PSEU|nr:hypothetical protein [Actinokineospora globicatena]GLW93194.1 hypothetical protein Aglo03_40100 [Actinokineospora globicatena]